MTKKSLPDLSDAYSEFIQIGKLKLKSFGGVVINSGKWIYIDQNGWFVADKKLES
jgi:regulator of RNase E activity RraA